ncbi:NAD-dependent epimerase/dehydratase family protein [Phycicoccus sp. BSK3Z-2]|uniref:NAD-dependent epimerase/dehydratase family protein n=1 Tax=Phycicoccus avicenniae TaxID=2828860 RepID=A0A941D730_9MICO|nr:NAD-dependent epimerase/dehydratase family protein [Phycicoccus avicenniae]MBR7743309.1 NAD-dependent epimerase/dehydratase family protein [Phycicoccus avicenniae]
MARVVLVTGVSRYLGGLLARRLAADPGVERVVGVDVIPPPHDIGDVEFVRADIRNPMIGRVIDGAGVDTVVHMNVIATPTFVGGRTPQKEINVIGTMQLLAACQKSRTVERLVVKSSAAVYGSTPGDPAMFTEDMGARRTPRGGFGKDSIEVEGYVRGFARRRPDTEILMLRFANVVGPRIRTSITDYFSLPVVPVPLGYDARMQFVHEDDAIEALVVAAVGGSTGVVNVAGDGVVTVYQAAALAGRPVLPLPLQSAGLAGGVARRLGLADFSPEQMTFLAFGRGLDTTRMRESLGFVPAHTSREAFAAFAVSLAPFAPGVQAVGDAVSGAAGTASQVLLRTLGAGGGR